jgi:hypothetical protein
VREGREEGGEREGRDAKTDEVIIYEKRLEISSSQLSTEQVEVGWGRVGCFNKFLRLIAS